MLEFPALRDLLRGYTHSQLGAARADALGPSGDRVWFQEQQRLTEEIREFLRVGGSFEFHGLEDHGRLIARAAIAGAALESLELRDIVTVIERATEWRKIAQRPPAAMQQEWTSVARLSARIGDFDDHLVLVATGAYGDFAATDLRQSVDGIVHQVKEDLQ